MRHLALIILLALGQFFFVVGQNRFPNAAKIVFDYSWITDNPSSTFSVDIDGDGDMDVLSASYLDDKIAWYENEDGRGKFGPQKIISLQADVALSVFAADVDNDGDQDVLSASAADDKIAWYENLDGNGNFGEQQVISENARSAREVIATDLDGDGDMDVLSASFDDNKIAWYENKDGRGKFGHQQIISLQAQDAESVFAIDLDGDGDMDVLSASSGDNKIAWYQNEDGMGSFGEQQIISEESILTNTVYAADFDLDGDKDVIYNNGYEVIWRENTDGGGSFGERKLIAQELYGIGKIIASDIDNDNDLDVVFAINAGEINDDLGWYENIDGAGNFSTGNYISAEANYATGVFTADLDGDGAMDVISASRHDNKIAWYRNTDNKGSFGDQDLISVHAHKCSNVFVSDINNDGDVDILSTSRDEIAWLENMGKNKGFSTLKPIFTSDFHIGRTLTADIDNDGDQDIISGRWWLENIASAASFQNNKFPSINGIFTQSEVASDFNGDGYIDVLATFRNQVSNSIPWFKNKSETRNFSYESFPIHDSDDSIEVVASISSADIDTDGDLDIITAFNSMNKIAWYENVDGNGSFGEQQIITNSATNVNSIFCTDLDGDGDMDVLAALRDHTVGVDIAWYENLDGAGNFGSLQLITVLADDVSDLKAVDLDGDNDMDVLSASLSDNKIAWYENEDGKGKFGAQQIIALQEDEGIKFSVADMDSDGDVDVLVYSRCKGKILWYENVNRFDVSGDNEVDIDDFLVLLGEFNRDCLLNECLTDFNSDNKVDTEDFLILLGEMQLD